jgi:hypothetical protein
MAVVEYMLYKENHRRLTPDFIGDRGHWFNPSDNTYIGWIEDNRDYYVPDTIVTLTKEQFVNRALSIHSAYPMGSNLEDLNESTTLTDDQVRLNAESWYDSFVAKNSG